eukprot:1737532-Amphidinium_carterae.1
MDLLSYGSDTEMPLRMMRQNADGHSLDDVPLRMTRRNADGDECIDARLRMCRIFVNPPPTIGPQNITTRIAGQGESNNFTEWIGSAAHC